MKDSNKQLNDLISVDHSHPIVQPTHFPLIHSVTRVNYSFVSSSPVSSLSSIGSGENYFIPPCSSRLALYSARYQLIPADLAVDSSALVYCISYILGVHPYSYSSFIDL